MSNNFENLKSRVESTGLFEEVLEFDEKREDFFPELEKYREDTGSFLGNLKNRIRFTKEYARLEASYVPVIFGLTRIFMSIVIPTPSGII